MKWKTTEYDGVRYREHATRKYGAIPDRYFSIRHYVDGKRIEEAMGWTSKGMTAQNAWLELARLQEAHRKGNGEPVTLREKRDKARAEREKVDSSLDDSVSYARRDAPVVACEPIRHIPIVPGERLVPTVAV